MKNRIENFEVNKIEKKNKGDKDSAYTIIISDENGNELINETLSNIAVGFCKKLKGDEVEVGNILLGDFSIERLCGIGQGLMAIIMQGIEAHLDVLDNESTPSTVRDLSYTMVDEAFKTVYPNEKMEEVEELFNYFMDVINKRKGN